MCVYINTQLLSLSSNFSVYALVPLRYFRSFRATFWCFIDGCSAYLVSKLGKTAILGQACSSIYSRLPIAFLYEKEPSPLTLPSPLRSSEVSYVTLFAGIQSVHLRQEDIKILLQSQTNRLQILNRLAFQLVGRFSHILRRMLQSQLQLQAVNVALSFSMNGRLSTKQRTSISLLLKHRQMTATVLVPVFRDSWT